MLRLFLLFADFFVGSIVPFFQEVFGMSAAAFVELGLFFLGDVKISSLQVEGINEYGPHLRTRVIDMYCVVGIHGRGENCQAVI